MACPHPDTKTETQTTADGAVTRTWCVVCRKTMSIVNNFYADGQMTTTSRTYAEDGSADATEETW